MTTRPTEEEDLIATLDVGTSSIRCLIFGSQRQVVAKHQIDIKRLYPHPSWVEQNAKEIITKSTECIQGAVTELTFAGYKIEKIKGLGISNQRETTVVWDKVSGEPLYNAILWLDNRTADLAEFFVNGKGQGERDCLQDICGLPIHPYFSALKLRWLMDNVPTVREAITRNTCLFGTVDSWVIWNLTGGVESGVHRTDVTNASRTMLMDLRSLQWSEKLLDFFDIPRAVLPVIHSSSQLYGATVGTAFAGKPIAGVLGDQMASMLGHGCITPGTAKNTYGTGCFLLANIGEEVKFSKCGLLTTVAYQLGPGAKPVYALEGSVAIAGAVITWLQQNLTIIQKAEDADELANTVQDNGGIYFVPAFSGLYAPYWDTEARGTICGLTEYVDKAHFVRAALESTAFQSCQILDAIQKDSGMQLTRLQADGGMSASNLLMQFQADMAGIPVCVPKMLEITSLGVAIAAAKAVNFVDFLQEGQPIIAGNVRQTYVPRITIEERMSKYSFWLEAVERSMHWAKDHSKAGPKTVTDAIEYAKATANEEAARHKLSRRSSFADGLTPYLVGATAGALSSLVLAGLLVLIIQAVHRR
ncbi:hypothetical protein RvY_03354-2 [Ramazzottius varieornatus]|uniref:Probable glycerol kinase n=1 Tax=Ramazzottius varieornatus TaxID=947166 RepID=A0A1D1UY00_RAMVA|nr:hypothetical protein RvY_03354-2 [Ramazzottius varieornatus]